ncbi:hypothetical protein C9374_003567 [Naegleria lovaniensis]|uniref:F-box domain-containing protein n=1 Tax=Naegleria lovaniensis TaxID=51637 RepID=A0AA88KQ22_NAELO|nr:uncharacterized protein C9374_003567 [Naegleria lovaniensis]KAG2393803.1 hypothetical protein C9374_003567 [Naegleria lovaniensis]
MTHKPRARRKHVLEQPQCFDPNIYLHESMTITTTNTTTHITSLPNELLFEIFQFGGISPFHLVQYSHVCKQWAHVLNEEPSCWYVWFQVSPAFLIQQHLNPMIRKKKIGLIQSSSHNPQICSSSSSWNHGLGFLLCKYFDHTSPLHVSRGRSSYSLAYQCSEKSFTQKQQQTALMMTDKVHTADSIQSPHQGAYNLVKLMKRPILVCKQQFMDYLQYSKKQQENIRRNQLIKQYLTQKKFQFYQYSTHLYMAVIVLIVLALNIGIGWYGSIPSEDQYLESGLWWMPYFLSTPFMLIGVAMMNVFIEMVDSKINGRGAPELLLALLLLLWISSSWIGFRNMLYLSFSKDEISVPKWQFLFPTRIFIQLMPIHVIAAFLLVVISCFDSYSDTDPIMQRSSIAYCSSVAMYAFLGFTNKVMIVLPLVLDGVYESIAFMIWNAWPLRKYEPQRFQSNLFASFIPISMAASLVMIALEYYSFVTTLPLTLSTLLFVGHELGWFPECTVQPIPVSKKKKRKKQKK